jgi:hypothetical protein
LVVGQAAGLVFGHCLKGKQIVRLFSLPWETKTNNLQPTRSAAYYCDRFWLLVRAAVLVFGHCLKGKQIVRLFSLP